MKIVVLDGKTLNPGDLSWEKLERLGDVTLYERTPIALTLERSAEAEILITNKAPLSAQVISQLQKLRYIGVSATGCNIVDVRAAVQHGVTVTNVPIYGTNSVAQMVFALLLELCHHVQAHSDAVRQGEWSRSSDFCFWNYPMIELAGKTMGIIGFGRIGQQVGRIASVLGMHVLAADIVQQNPPELEHFRWAEIPELLGDADVVSLHCPLVADTKGLISRQNIERMKHSAFLINSSRGGLVLDTDLAAALNEGRIAGAGLDVLSTEPPQEDNPLLTARNCLITPHIAWATKEARSRLLAVTIDNLEAYLADSPQNVVS